MITTDGLRLNSREARIMLMMYSVTSALKYSLKRK